MDSNKYFNLSSWASFDINGEDSKRFLSGQLTSDLNKLFPKSSQLTARVSRTGNLLFYGYLIYINENYYKIITPQVFVDDFIEDLKKFAIMDEVEFSKENETLIVGNEDNQLLEADYIINFLGKPTSFKFSKDHLSFEEYEITRLEFMYGIPSIPRIQEEGILVNQTVFVDEAVSNEKGCYVGQETVKKIEANRGAGKKSVALILKNKANKVGEFIKVNEEEYKILGFSTEGDTQLVSVEAKRSIRVQDKQVTIEIEGNVDTAKVRLFPILNKSIESISTGYYEKAVSFFTSGNNEEAIKWMELAFRINPNDKEIAESFGALVGRLGDLKKAIEIMDHLELIDPDSIMAHTNKSLFYMKLGEIEKAEDEKSKATVKGFKNTAKQNSDKKEELNKRLGMFKQVLEIDEEDELANQGAAEIYFEFGEIEKSKLHLEKLISINNKNFKAMALMAKILIKESRNDEALELLKKVSLISGEKGDFVLANETQSLINSLEIPSSS
ncbi:MAG: hypothetical protein CME70_07850 [Halobacteriovorax sp.]|nr:hypothetical protein [Halobacteriovorax sp.]|tara:strand:- start:265468 stop:266964 length:1497 start_codon:yes stop_codon:yes gene_type:complete